MPGNSTQYTAVAITLHWVIAAAILVNLGLGIWMHEAIDVPQSRERAIAGYQLHKSIGLSILVLSLLRLTWRFLFPPPPLPGHMAAWQRALAKLIHWIFYVLMIGIPLSGWLYVSAQWRDDAPLNVPTLWFGQFEVPHLFDLNEAAETLRHRLADIAIESHELLAFSLLGLLVLHVGAALRHQFIERDGVLARMLPGLVPSAPEPIAHEPQRSRPLVALATVAGAVLFIYAATSLNLSPHGGTGAAMNTGAVLQALVPADATQTPSWQVLVGESDIGFTGSHVGKAFRGEFTRWQAAIRFDPAKPGQSAIAAVIETASATDGVRLHDRTLPQDEWFDVAGHPHATYRSTGIEPLGDGRYAVHGKLGIKEQVVDLPPLTLSQDDEAINITGEVEVDRADFNMGMESDPDGQYVSRKIGITVDVNAVRQR